MVATVVQQAIRACRWARRSIRSREILLHTDERIWTFKLRVRTQLLCAAFALTVLGGTTTGTVLYVLQEGNGLERRLAAAVDLAEARAVAAEAGRAALQRDLAMTEAEALRLVQEAMRLEEMARDLSTWLVARDTESALVPAVPASAETRADAEWEDETAVARMLAERQEELVARIDDLELELTEAEKRRREYDERIASAGQPGRDGEMHRLADEVAEAVAGLRQSAESARLLEAERDQYAGELAYLAPETDAARVRRDSLRELVWSTEAARQDADSVVRQLAGGRAVLTVELARLDAERAALNARLGQLRGTMDRLQDSLAMQQAEARELAATRLALARERDAMASERDRAESRARVLDQYLVQLANNQVEMVDRVAREMDARIDEAERTIALTGLTAEQLLDGLGGRAQGGPFIPLTPDTELAGHPLSGSLAALTSRIERWDELRMVMSRLPFAAPMDAFLITSQFGRRTDPLNSRAAFHAGVDFIGPTGARIYAPAPGLVVYAGWRGGYGRLVDIDHGMGIVTRYAHLASIDVQRGDEVGYRDRIGVMGASGRVTGAHLHYEVRVDGEPIDPMKFIRAGRQAYQQVEYDEEDEEEAD